MIGRFGNLIRPIDQSPRSSMSLYIATSALLIIVLLAPAKAIKFVLEPSKSAYVGRGECVTYRIPGNQLVTGKLMTGQPHGNEHYSIGAYIYGRDGSQPISLRDLTVDTPFSFLTTDKQNEYDVCFRAVPKPKGMPGQPHNPIPPNLEFVVGVQLSYIPDTFDEKTAAEVKLRPVEGDFIISEEKMRQVAAEMSSYLRSEEKLRDVNESTLEMVTWLSIISMVGLIAIGGYQVYYLKGYFRTKKLI